MTLKDNFASLKFHYTHCKLSVLTLQSIQSNQDHLNFVQLSDDFFNTATFSRSLSSQIFRYSIIQFVSFLDEYASFNNSLDDKLEKIIDVRKKNSWGLKMINKKWPDLRKYRNNIVAHNFNINGQSFFSNYENKKHEYRVPGNLNEQLFLIKIFEKICSNIYFEFETILQDTTFHQQNLDENLKIIIDENFDLINEIKLIEVNMN